MITNTNCKYTVYVGNNGVGKSGILESLDVVLNNREWNTTSGAKINITATIIVFLLSYFSFISYYNASTHP